MKRETAIVVAGCLLLGAGASCTGSAKRPIDDSSAAVKVVQDYVRLLAQGKVDEALTLRCKGFAVEPNQRSLFMSQLNEMKKRLGSLDETQAKVIASTGLQPPDDEVDREVEVSYQIVSSGKTHPPLLTVTALQDGRRRICGISNPAARRLGPLLRADLESARATKRPPHELLSFELPPGARELESKIRKALPENPGELDGWTRSWRINADHAARASVIAYEDAEGAVDFVSLAVIATELAADGIKRITIPGVPQARAARILGFAWLGVQPPDVPPYIDEAVIAYGNFVVEVQISGLTTEGHDLLIDVMKRIDARVEARTRST